MSATHEPPDTLKPVATDVWAVDARQSVGPLELPIRMTVLRLADGGLWLHSPTPHGAGIGAALEAIGPVRHLVAPDTAHWMHLRGWQDAAPAMAWGAPGLAARLKGKRDAPRIDRELGEEPPAAWAGQVEQVVFSAPGFAEVAFHHRASRTLVLTDTVQAMEPARLPLLTRLFARLAGSAGEGTAPVYLRLAMRAPAHRARNRAAAERVLAWQPRRVIFAHGTPFETDATARLERAFAWALRP